MLIVFDLFRKYGMTAFFRERQRGEAITVPNYIPWDTLDLSGEVGRQSLRDYLEKQLYFYSRIYNENIKLAGFIIPYDLPYAQSRYITRMAESMGVQKVRLYRSTECLAMMETKLPDDMNHLFVRQNFDRVEYGLFIYTEGIVECLGITGTRMAAHEDEAVFVKRAAADINQLLRDCATTRSDIASVNCSGLTSDLFVQQLRNISGKSLRRVEGYPVQGAIELLKIPGGYSEHRLMLQSTPRDISVCLGEYGERATVIPRYATFPVYNIAQLLMSTESVLHVYEGNFGNPRFDTEIASFDLSRAAEGHEIACRITVDERSNMELIVTDHTGATLIQTNL